MGNLTLDRTALPARTETHDFLVHKDALAFNGHYGRQRRDTRVFEDVDSNRKRAFRVPGLYHLPDFYTNHL